MALLHRRAGLPDLPHLQGLHGPHSGSAAARRGRCRTCTWRRIEALALAIDAKDQTAQSHIRRVQVYAAGIARALGMTDNEIQGVKTAALLHDIGKLAVPEHILSKPGPLTQEEFQKIRDPPAGRRRNHQRRAVPVSGGAADPAATTSAGTARAIPPG